MSVTTCGGLVHGVFIFGGGAYFRRFTVYHFDIEDNSFHLNTLCFIYFLFMCILLSLIEYYFLLNCVDLGYVRYH
jgi:hypothetical protein